MSKVALITGTSSGIGLSTAVVLARAGFTVIATMRNVNKADALRERAGREGVTLDIQPLDVSSTAAVDACVGDIVKRHGRVDVLVNNAGAGYVGTTEQTPLAEFERMMDVNFYGVVRVTKAVLPHMRAARSGRIINLSSVGGIIGQPFNDAYCAAKFAVEGMVESIAPLVRGFGIHVSLVEPGPVNTEYIANLRDSLDKRLASTDDPYAPLFQAYIQAVSTRYEAVGQSGDDVAQVILEAATAETPQLRYPTSELVKTIASKKYTDPTGNVVLALSGAVAKPAS